MSLVKGGITALNTSTGVQTISGLGFEPVLVIFQSVFRTAAGGDTGDIFFCVGAHDDNQGFCTAFASEDAVSPSNSRSVFRDNRIMEKVNPGSGSSPVSVSFGSTNSDGFTININTTDGSAYLFQWTAYAYIDAHIDVYKMDSSSGTQGRSGVGFRADLVAWFGLRVSSENSLVNNVRFAAGIDNGTSRVGVGAKIRDNRTSGIVASVLSTQYAMWTLNDSGSTDGRMSIDSFNSDGYDMDIDNGFGSETWVGAIAIKGVRSAAGSDSFKTTTGTKATTGVGFQPDLIWKLHGNEASLETIHNNVFLGISFGWLDSQSFVLDQGGINISQTNSVPTNLTKTQNRDLVDIRSTANVDLTRGGLSSMDLDGFTIDYSQVQGDGRLFGYFCMRSERISGTASLEFTATGELGMRMPITGFSNLVFFLPPAPAYLVGDVSGGTTLDFSTNGDVTGRSFISGSSSLSFTTSGVQTSKWALSGQTSLTFTLPGSIFGVAASNGTTGITFTTAGRTSNTVAISGSSSLEFTTNGDIRISEGSIGDITTTFDLRGTGPKQVKIFDNFDYDTVPSDINDVDAIITVTGPKGVFYNNEDYDNPDIVPATNRNNQIPIYLPMDPQTGYENALKGNYTVKVSRRDRVSQEVFEVTLLTYSFQKDKPVITNETVSGPYSATLTSVDTTDYGGSVDVLNRTHTVEYPEQLSPRPDPIISSSDTITVTTIYTNKWFITINSYIEYRFADTLRVIYDETGEFTHCVYGSCIDALAPIVDEALTIYREQVACQIGNQEVLQKKLVTINTAWHLLNVAYQAGDVEEADKQAAIIQQEAEAAVGGDGTCGSDTSDLVEQCPPYEGGGGGCGCLADNGLTRNGDVIELGGVLNRNTAINTDVYAFTLAGAAAGTSYSLSMAYNTGIQYRASDINSETRILQTADLLSLDWVDLATPINSRGYDIGVSGLVEQADYSATYVSRSLVAKDYVEANFLSSQPNGWAAIPSKPVPEPNDIFVFEDSADGLAKKTASLTEIRGQTAFIDLIDTPSTYVGEGNKLTAVKASEDGMEFVSTETYVQVDQPGQFKAATLGKIIPADDDLLLVQDVSDGILERYGYIEIGDIQGTTTFIELTDTPATYAGFADYFLKVNAAADAIEFIQGAWVPETGGTFTGPVAIETSQSEAFTIQKTTAGDQRIQFRNSAGEPTTYLEQNTSGDAVMGTNAPGRSIVLSLGTNILGNLVVAGNIIVTGVVDGVDISAFKADYDVHGHTWSEITDTPTTLAGYGITDAMLNTPSSWLTEFVSKADPILTDRLLIEDDAALGEKKYITIGDLPTGGGASTFIALTDTPTDYLGAADYTVEVNSTADGLVFRDIRNKYIQTADGTLNALTAKLAPIDTDVLLIEDSEVGYVQKKITIGDIQTPITGGGVYINWNFSTDTTDADPGSGYLRFNDGVLANVGFIYINPTAANGIDLTDRITNLNAKDLLYVQQVNDINKTVLYEVTGAAIDATTYYKVPVTYKSDSGGGLFTNNQLLGILFQEFVQDYVFIDSIWENPTGTIQLLNDVTNPGSNYFYGTDGLGIKGWYAQADPLPHADTHWAGGIDQLSHDLLLDYVALEHVRWDLPGVEKIASDRLDGVAVLTTGAQTAAGVKTWSDRGIFSTGIDIPTSSYTSDSGIRLGASGTVQIYESAASQLRIGLSTNTDLYLFNTSNFRTDGNTRWGLMITGTTRTAPNIVPRVGDTTTGVGSSAYGEMSLITGGIEALRLDNLTTPGTPIVSTEHYLGVGTSTPVVQMHIDGGGDPITDPPPASSVSLLVQGSGHAQMAIMSDAAALAVLAFGNVADYNPGGIQYDNFLNQLAFRTNNVADRMILDSSGRLGIGVSPSAQLHISGGVGTLSTGLVFGNGGTGFYELADDQLRITIGTTDRFQFQSSSFEATASNGARMISETPSATNPVFCFSGDPDTGIGRASADTLSLIAGSTEVQRLTSTLTEVNTEVNIGDVSGFVHTGGAYRLQLGSAGTNTFSAYYMVGTRTTDNPLGQIAFCNTNSLDASKRNALIAGKRDGTDSGGELEFYTATTAGTLTLNMSIDNSGDVFMQNLSSSSPPDILYYAPGTGLVTYGALSDARTKENIRPWAVNALECISEIPVMEYRHLTAGHEEFGLIAQDVERQLPAMVGTDKEGMKLIHERYWWPVHHRAIQQLLERIEYLEQKLENHGEEP